jgi:hypothetical protein
MPSHSRPMPSSPMRKLRKTGAVDPDGYVVTIPRLPSVAGSNKPPGWNRWSDAEKVEHLLGMSPRLVSKLPASATGSGSWESFCAGSKSAKARRATHSLVRGNPGPASGGREKLRTSSETARNLGNNSRNRKRLRAPTGRGSPEF